MEPFKQLLQKRLNQHKLGASAQAAEALAFANRHFWEGLGWPADQVRALSVEKGVLWVGVSHAVWSQELAGAATKLLQILQEKWGADFIQKVRAKDLTAA